MLYEWYLIEKEIKTKQGSDLIKDTLIITNLLNKVILFSPQIYLLRYCKLVDKKSIEPKG